MNLADPCRWDRARVAQRGRGAPRAAALSRPAGQVERSHRHGPARTPAEPPPAAL